MEQVTKAAVWREDAAAVAGLDHHVTFGIVPACPEAGFGYIEAGETLLQSARRVESFVEKPDAASAAKMLAEGGYFWNSGMFMIGAGYSAVDQAVIMAQISQQGGLRDKIALGQNRAQRPSRQTGRIDHDGGIVVG